MERLSERIESSYGASSTVNVSQPERIISAVAAPLLAYVGARRGGLSGVVLGAIAAELAYRGVTGHSPIYAALGVNTAVSDPNAQISVPHEQGIHIEQSVYVARPRSELFTFWRNLSNLPRVIHSLKSVQDLGHGYSHWVAMGPIGLIPFQWDAEIVNEQKDEVIAWRTLPGSFIAHAGSVRFEATPDALGTTVHIDVEYAAPGGQVGHMLASVLDNGPEQQLSESLEGFKTLMETGKLPTRKSKLERLKMGSSKSDVAHLPVEARRTNIERRADPVQMASEDSFPASDPPGGW